MATESKATNPLDGLTETKRMSGVDKETGAIYTMKLFGDGRGKVLGQVELIGDVVDVTTKEALWKLIATTTMIPKAEVETILESEDMETLYRKHITVAIDSGTQPQVEHRLDTSTGLVFTADNRSGALHLYLRVADTGAIKHSKVIGLVQSWEHHGTCVTYTLPTGEVHSMSGAMLVE